MALVATPAKIIFVTPVYSLISSAEAENKSVG